MFPLDFENNIAVVTNQRDYTYQELKEVSESLASQVEARSLVLSIAGNGIDCLIGYVGFLNRGAIHLLLNSDTTPESVTEIIDLYQPEYIFTPSGYTLEERSRYDYAAKMGEYELLRGEKRHVIEPHPNLALMLSTSGSTGSQKFVRLSEDNVLSNAYSIIEYLGIDESERAITTLPFSYTYGLSIINSHLLAGASIILTEKTLFDREFWQLFKDKGATSFGGVPYTYEMLKQLRFARMDLPSLRYITQAGGRLGQKLHEEFATLCGEKSIDFVVMYGQTEATARITYLPPELAATKIGSIGKAIPGGEITLRGEKGEIIHEPGVEGELVYRGPNVSMGYAENREDLALGDTRGGVLETGDIAQFDEDGMYYIVGRKKRFLKIFGNRVNLDEVEGLLYKEGLTAAATGKDDDCLICLESSGEENIDEDNKSKAIEVLQAKTGIHKSAFKVKVLDTLPRSESGKIQYAQLEG